MSKSSTAISLVLLTTASAGFIGYKAVTSAPDPAFVADVDNSGGSDFDDEAPAKPTTQPSSPPLTPPFVGQPNSSPGYYAYHTTHVYSPGYFGSNSFARSQGAGSSSGEGSRGSSSHESGTSRGGFGTTGHAMGHAGE
jgi:hypothetical protein